MIRCGLDRLLRDTSSLAERSYGLLAHGASVTSDLSPIVPALTRSAAGPPLRLFAPEHGFWGVEQDMISVDARRDPYFDLETVSLYGSDEASLRPQPSCFEGLEILLIDLQDVGARYYTYAATAIWAAEAALAAEVEIWVLDRPNPLGGLQVEGGLPDPGFESFVSAFDLPVRHGLTLGELHRLEAQRRGWDEAGLRILPVEGWQREVPSKRAGWTWRSPSPNMPTQETAFVYPGGCLIEATELSEGRGTTQPFHLVGAPGLDGLELAKRMNARGLPGARYLPTCFRPQFQKHGGRACGGVEIVVTDQEVFPSYRAGVELLEEVWSLDPDAAAWRSEPYEFVIDRPAIDLLTGGEDCRRLLEEGGDVADWIASWSEGERSFLEERESVLLYS